MLLKNPFTRIGLDQPITSLIDLQKGDFTFMPDSRDWEPTVYAVGPHTTRMVIANTDVARFNAPLFSGHMVIFYSTPVILGIYWWKGNGRVMQSAHERPLTTFLTQRFLARAYEDGNKAIHQFAERTPS